VKGKAGPVAALLFAAAAWGATFVIVKAAIHRVEPELFLAVRFLIGGLILLLVAGMRRELDAQTLRDGTILGIALWAGYWMQTRGLLTITPARSAFLTSLAVVLAPVVDHLLFGNRIGGRKGFGALLAFGGALILTDGWRAQPSIGDLLTVGAAVAFAVHLVLTSRYAPRRPAVGLAAVQVLAVAAASAPMAVRQPAAALSEPYVIYAILLTAVLTTALAMLLMVWAQARLSATEAAILLSFEPVAAAATSIAVEGETLSVALLAGGALILAAMLLSQTGTLPEHAADPRHQR
jgi:drug/metabolite transporter (DMT)-like permease